MHIKAREAGAAGARVPTLTEGQLLSVAEEWCTAESFTDLRRNVKSELCIGLGAIYTTAPPVSYTHLTLPTILRV